MEYIDLLIYNGFKIDESHQEQVRQLGVQNKALHQRLINRYENLM